PPLGNPELPPTGPAVPFPDLALRETLPVPSNSEFKAPGGGPGDPRVDWRSLDAALGRADLNRFLPPYPHPGEGLSHAAARAAPLVPYGSRFDAGGAGVLDHFLEAQAARQGLADDIYRRLLAATGVSAPADSAQPTDEELQPRRWLAQLAANIVDFLDEVEIS